MTWSLASGVVTAVSAATESDGDESILLPAWYDIVFGSLTFLIIFLLFWKYVMPRMREVLAERTERIEGGMAKAEQMQDEAKESLAKYQAQLATARDEAAAIREKAEADKLQIIAEAKREAEAQASAVQATANAQIDAARLKAAADLRKDAGQVATDLAGRIVGESLDPERSKRVVDRFIDELEQAGQN